MPDLTPQSTPPPVPPITHAEEEAQSYLRRDPDGNPVPPTTTTGSGDGTMTWDPNGSPISAVLRDVAVRVGDPAVPGVIEDGDADLLPGRFHKAPAAVRQSGQQQGQEDGKCESAHQQFP
jgi:hypothetical protein